MSNVDIRNIIDQIFDGSTDWYGLVDEVGIREANDILGSYHAVYWIDHSGSVWRGRLSYSSAEFEIIESHDVELSWLIFQDRFEEVRDEFVDRGYIYPGSLYFERDAEYSLRGSIYYEI